MCTEYLMNLYNPMESLTTDEYNALMAELATDEDEDDEYNDGKYHMLWLNETDERCEEEYETMEEMIDSYNEVWADGGWDFIWIDKNGHEFYPWSKQ